MTTAQLDAAHARYHKAVIRRKRANARFRSASDEFERAKLERGRAEEEFTKAREDYEIELGRDCSERNVILGLADNGGVLLMGAA